MFENSLTHLFFAGDSNCKSKCYINLERRVAGRTGIACRELESSLPIVNDQEIPMVVEETEIIDMVENASDDEYMEGDEIEDSNDSDYVPEEEGEEDLSKAIKLEAVAKLLHGKKSMSEADRQRSSNGSRQRQAACLAEDLGVDILQVKGASLTTINKNRENHRRDVAKQFSENLDFVLKQNPKKLLMVHWDGKLLPNNTGGIELKVDRLPVALSGLPMGGDTILEIEKLVEGTGLAQAQHIHKVLCKHNLAERVQLCCYDTTASNSGHLHGAVVLLEKLLRCILLGCPCQHHVDELVIGKIMHGLKLN